MLKVIASHDDGWYLVQNAHGAFGVVPGNYLFVTPKVSPPFRSFQSHAEEYHWNAQGCSAQKYNDAYCDSSPPLHTHEIPRIRHARTHHLRLLLSPSSLSLSLLAHTVSGHLQSSTTLSVSRGSSVVSAAPALKEAVGKGGQQEIEKSFSSALGLSEKASQELEASLSALSGLTHRPARPCLLARFLISHAKWLMEYLFARTCAVVYRLHDVRMQRPLPLLGFFASPRHWHQVVSSIPPPRFFDAPQVHERMFTISHAHATFSAMADASDTNTRTSAVAVARQDTIRARGSLSEIRAAFELECDIEALPARLRTRPVRTLARSRVI